MTAKIVYLFTPMAKTDDTYPNRIREIRKAKGMTQDDVAQRIGIANSFLGLLERGLRPLTVDRARALARVLGVDIADLLSAQDHPNALTADEKRLIEAYRRLPAPGRNSVSSLAENLQQWGTPPSEDDTRRRA